jgi:hypothetical protein
MAGLALLPVQTSTTYPEPVSMASLSDEVVGENCYVSREPVADENGRVTVQVEVLCD